MFLIYRALKRQTSWKRLKTGRLVINPNDHVGPRNECKKQTNRSLLTVLLHDAQEFDNNLRARSDEDLALSSLLGIVDGVKRIVQHGSLDHFVGVSSRFSNRERLRK